MPTKKAEEKAVKRIEKAVKRAVHKGMPEIAVERAVDKGIKRGARHKSAAAKQSATTDKPVAKKSKAGKPDKKRVAPVD